jgi:hypothetical protein
MRRGNRSEGGQGGPLSIVWVAFLAAIGTGIGGAAVGWGLNWLTSGRVVRAIGMVTNTRPSVPLIFPQAIICSDTRPKVPPCDYVFRLSAWSTVKEPKERWIEYSYGASYLKFTPEGELVPAESSVPSDFTGGCDYSGVNIPDLRRQGRVLE